MLTVGSIICAKAVDVDYQGQGIVKHEDHVIFVRGMLKDEVANIQIKTLKKRFAEGFIISLITPSLHRRDHADLAYGSMDLLHMKDEEQLSWQVKTTKETFLKVGQMDLVLEPIITDRKFVHYRNKSVFHVMNHPTLTLGLFHINQSGLTPITSFLLADEITNQIIGDLIQAHISIDHTKLKHIAIRTNENQQALVTLVAATKSFKGLNSIVEVLKSNKHVVGVTLNVKDHPHKIFGNVSYALYGQNMIDMRLGQYTYPVTDQTFFQVNIPVISMAYQLIKDHLLKDAHVIDLYSGVGSIGYYLIDHIASLKMIETNKDAIQMAQMIKEKYQLNQVTITHGEAESMIKTHENVLIVDPPRSGLQAKLIDHILTDPFEQMFYLSCDLKTLVRDLKVLTTCYQIDKVYPIRMFPQTTECETLVILRKK